MESKLILRWQRLIRVGVIIPLLFLIIPIHAQQVLNVGDSITAQLTTTTPEIGFNFNGTPGSPLQIDIIAIDDGLALQAVVLAPDGRLALAISNDGTQNRIRGNLPNPQNGGYMVLVNDINGNTGTFVITLTGEATCETVIESVLGTAQENCGATERNQVCIGVQTVTGVLRADFQPTQFTSPGDEVPVTALESLSLTPLDTNTREMGTVLMRVQADLPDTLPGQSVTLLLFGGIEVTNRTVTEPDLATIYSPMQAFFFRPGVGSASCEAAPTEGVIIKTPEQAGMVRFNINGADIVLGSTALLTLDSGTGLQVALLEGSAVVAAAGVTQGVVAGQQVAIPVNVDFEAAGPPSPPQPIAPGAPILPIDIIAPIEPSPTPTTSLPSQPTLAPIPPTATATPGRPPLPDTGVCILRSLEDNVSVNVRRLPGTDFDIVASLDPQETYNVIGRNQAGNWYQLSTGWVAGFVTERGGNCNGLPITYVAPTATPTPTATPFVSPTPLLTTTPIGNACQNFNSNINISAGSVGVVADLLRDISYTSDCSGSYTVRYTLLDVNQFPDRDLRWSISCTGDGAGFLEIAFSDGTTTPCTSSAYNFRSSVRRGDDFFTVRYSFLPGGQGVTSVSVIMSVLE